MNENKTLTAESPAPASSRTPTRRLPIGAEIQSDGVDFRLWAPAARQVSVNIDGGETHPLLSEPGGYWSIFVPGLLAGQRYGFCLDGQSPLSDPASRYQPRGPHGLSQIIDPADFSWSDLDWKGLPREALVIYEMHVGTFTAEGTWAAAMKHLPALAEVGITCIEMMPVADFPGQFGWGYDGVNLFAPCRLYGEPNDLRQFVDRAHRLGIAVILDVVYNHLGPDGNFLPSFASAYLTDRYANEWGNALNFDGPDSGPVREFFIANAGYWIDEFHFDGLRLDATQQIFDASEEHILVAIGRRVREVAGQRQTFIASENEPQVARLVRPLGLGGYGLDALWNDDFHHTAMVALTGHSEAYYSDYWGTASELIAAAKHGFLYQGQYYAWQGQRRGTPCLDLQPTNFVAYLQNHDQVANSAQGLRGHQLASPGKWRAITAYLLLSPAIPLLFQGEEFSASTPFLYFADHHGALAGMVRKGRGEFLQQFPSIADPETQSQIAAPGNLETFRRCVLDDAERLKNVEAIALHHDLLALRRKIFAAGSVPIDGAVINEHCFLLRYFVPHGSDYVLIVNLGRDRTFVSIPDPLIAPIAGKAWRMEWSSEHPRYGGAGVTPVFSDEACYLRGQAAVLLAPGEAAPLRAKPMARRTA